MYLKDGGDDIQGGRHQLLGDWTSGGSVEDGGGDTKPPPWVGYHPTRCTSQILGRSWYGDLLPQRQTASAANVHEVGGPLRDISGPSQGI